MINKTSLLSIWLKKLEKSNKKVINLIELKSIAKKLDILHLDAFVFVVSGTNGKGTTCTMLETLFLNAGYRVGLYTSPHIVSYLERVRINGCCLTEEEHVSSFKLVEYERKNSVLSYFEFSTLSALSLFKKYLLDVVILEVGIGGRLDATNIVDSNISIITNIGIDHTNMLGFTRSNIAREKAGIFRRNKISVIGEENIPNSMNKVAKKIGVLLKKINLDWFWKKHSDHWHFIHSNITLYDLPLTQIPLSNAALALSAIYYSGLKINESIIRNTIAHVKLPGRFQVISSAPYIVLDVAHNVHAALHLSKKIDELFSKKKIYAVVGMCRDKNIRETINCLKDQVHYWYTAPLKHSRTANINQLNNCFPKNNTFFFNSIHDAYSASYKIAKKEDVILVFGSFFAISEVILSNNIAI
ncbi:bifunctional tetrahydrofolate synthase/dihydrofolate synthase [Buchnera aphidicola (Hyadaphis tataricae)]|uniref:Dihydrofolate synthase/folylpolyglutamate synthase n=1 Tax=Buchnera aphidicola (Hyadaphis tataricae) TaxID=1241859 RepID=A0A4D6XY73_9GAMM|nr:bifunctional tetrahydrofolate synthase/dihydrofolate synthase [Buchnera aphidicola]QCI21483.1 bifunctional tetrahydrofolate synthase/dihydrofolate synthase [Buchnera aphidicola (Hyadaphis tataricae)]